jgi:16S rRNA (guanine966-N2)-methyltransferase
LFNWLAPVIDGARCLDLFAGTGALGFEAASRGAAEVIMVDRDPVVVEHLRGQARALRVEGVTVIAADAEQWLAQVEGRFDVIFLDPPFGAAELPRCCARLAAASLLAPGGFAYLETDAAFHAVALPDAWRIHRKRRAGRVRYMLATPVAAGEVPRERA